jgi:hypothetical protein
MNRFLGVILLGVAASGLASAGNPVVYQTAPAYQVAPQAVYLYAAQYHANGTPANAEAIERHTAALNRLADAVEKNTAEMQAFRLSRASGPVTIEPPGVLARPLPGGDILQQKAGPTALSAARNACSMCHSPFSANENGGGFVMFTEGAELAPLDAREKRRVAARVGSGSMPPAPRKIDAADKAALVEFFK